MDVFRLTPSKFLTQEEIDASNQVHFDILNVQNQPHIEWPQNFVVAKAYVAQLDRSGALSAARLTALKTALAKAEHSSSKDTKELQAMAGALEKDAASSKSPADANRMKALAAILRKNAGKA